MYYRLKNIIIEIINAADTLKKASVVSHLRKRCFPIV